MTDDIEQKQDPQDDFVSIKQLNAALAKDRRAYQKDIQELKALLADFTPQSPKTKELEEEPNTMKALKEQIKALQERDRIRDQELKLEKLNKTAKDLLAKKGVDSKHLDYAYRVLKDDLGFDEDGTMVMKDEFGINVPINEGIDKWSASEVSQVFKAPKQVNGTGNQAVKNTKTQVQTTEKMQYDASGTAMPKTITDAREALKVALQNGAKLTG